jgi:hypothetical protein
MVALTIITATSQFRSLKKKKRSSARDAVVSEVQQSEPRRRIDDGWYIYILCIYIYCILYIVYYICIVLYILYIKYTLYYIYIVYYIYTHHINIQLSIVKWQWGYYTSEKN